MPKRSRKQVLVGFVLDSSSSMEPLRKTVVTGFNNQLKEIRDRFGAEVDTYVTLVTFADRPNVVLDAIHLDHFEELSYQEYHPWGMTALYDAIGMTIDRLQAEAGCSRCGHDTNVILVILTDGHENYSKEFSRADVANRVRSLKKAGRWTFAFIGTNDSILDGQNLGLTTATWSPTIGGTITMYDNLAKAFKTYYTTTIDGTGESPDELFGSTTNDAQK